MGSPSAMPAAATSSVADAGTHGGGRPAAAVNQGDGTPTPLAGTGRTLGARVETKQASIIHCSTSPHPDQRTGETGE